MHKMKEPWTGNVVGRMHVYGIKNDELARRCGYSPQYLSMVLNGKRPVTQNTKDVIFVSLSSIEQEVRHE